MHARRDEHAVALRAGTRQVRGLHARGRAVVERCVGDLHPRELADHRLELEDGLQDALRGLEKITFDGADLLLALTRPSMPCTPEAFDKRFREYLARYLEGKDPSKVRIQVDW